MLIDLHTHTRRWSWDSDLDPNDLIERSKAAGLDGICLSEHDYFWDPDEVLALGRKHSYLVLPAIELNTEEGHMLCYGLESYVYGMHRAAELAEHIREAGGAMVAAHPYRRQMPWQQDEASYSAALQKAARNAAYAHCQALESLNGRGSARENDFSARLCDYMSMPGTAGTDSHAISDIGKCATEFTRRVESVEDLIEELRAGRFRAVDLRAGSAAIRQQEAARPVIQASLSATSEQRRGGGIAVAIRTRDAGISTEEDKPAMTQETESKITDEMRASIGREGPPVRHEVDKTSIRMFARAVGYTDPIFYDEEHAKSKGHRSLVAPPSYLGTSIFNPNTAAAGGGGPRGRALNGGNEFEYTGVEICAGDILTSVGKVISIDERKSSLGTLIITRRETVYTNQNGEVVCRAYGTALQY